MTVRLTTPLGEGGLRIARIEYKFNFYVPGAGSAWLKIEGTLDQDPEKEAKAVFKTLVENGFVSTAVMSKTTYYDQHTSIHAVDDEKKPSTP